MMLFVEVKSQMNIAVLICEQENEAQPESYLMIACLITSAVHEIALAPRYVFDSPSVS